ncbi:hypothetical protein [Mongoliimonas terrestris]|uniref:hypothetical protein n=1 Tax=Mongoliimonas terrestris TaxID=1709001 RepID=UPI000949713A|nr:hypothetical protein [Mongoliimonas terrestris]
MARPTAPGGLALGALLLGALLPITGCTARYDFSTVEVARTAMVGLSGQDVRMCAGFPDRTSTEDGVTVWSYEQETKGNGLTVSTPVLFGAANTAVNMSSGGSCRVQVRFKDGRVDRVAYAGDNDGPRGRDSLCTPVIDDCITYAQRFRPGRTVPVAADAVATGSIPEGAATQPAATAPPAVQPAAPSPPSVPAKPSAPAKGPAPGASAPAAKAQPSAQPAEPLAGAGLRPTAGF